MVKKILKIFLILLTLELMLFVFKVPQTIIPAPSDVILAFYNDFPTIMINLLYTLIEIFLGLFFSILFSILLSILMYEFKYFKKVVLPLVIGFQSIPIIVIAPIFIIWFGIGIISKLLLIVCISSFPLIISLLGSFENIDLDKYYYIKSLKIGKVKEYKILYFNESILNYYLSLKIVLSYIVLTTIFAEYMGSQYGIGVYLNKAFGSFQIDKVFVVVIILIVIVQGLLKINDLVYKYMKEYE